MSNGSFPLNRKFFEAGKDLTDPEGLADLLNELYEDIELAAGGVEITQTTWWIDKQNGDNDNDGLTEATALKDFAEFNHRVGPNPLVTQTITVNIATLIHNPLPPEGIVMEATFYGADAAIIFKGKLGTGQSNTVGTYVAMDQAPPNGTDGYVTDSGAFTWDTEVGNLIGFSIGGET